MKTCDTMTLAIRSPKPKPTPNVDLWDLGQRPQHRKNPAFSLHGLFLSGAMILTSCFLWSATGRAEIARSQAINAIVGEAENQGLKGMTAVAEAIRNRGTLKGVYGVKSPRLKKAPKWVFAMASKAWDESQKSNLVKGATHWENTKAFGTPYWVKSMQKTATIKDHVFYREVVK